MPHVRSQQTHPVVLMLWPNGHDDKMSRYFITSNKCMCALKISGPCFYFFRPFCACGQTHGMCLSSKGERETEKVVGRARLNYQERVAHRAVKTGRNHFQLDARIHFS